MSDVDAYVKSVNADLQEIVMAIRTAIKEGFKELKEEMKWNIPTYSINKNVCAIAAHKNHVNLQVFKGAKIKDARLLEGTGKGMRHLKYEHLSDVKVAVIKRVIKQAISIDS